MMATKSMVLAAALVGVAAALAKPKPTKTVCGVICVDSINECGQKYGGCYDPCTESAPTPPPCTTLALKTWYPTPIPVTTSEEVANCSSITVCVDGINSCGIPFGDCIPDCKPWNIFTPPCPPDALETIPWSPATPTDAAEEAAVVEEPETSEGTDAADAAE
ncbi:hypothetical protein V8C37DRAFT_391693 [Trichoderma ceciliae]